MYRLTAPALTKRLVTAKSVLRRPLVTAPLKSGSQDTLSPPLRELHAVDASPQPIVLKTSCNKQQHGYYFFL